MMNLTDSDWGLIHDAITWELNLLPLHQGAKPSPRRIRMLEIQKMIDDHLAENEEA